MVGICVLPFANMSGDPEQEYFSDGITEDIITDLSKVSALSIVSRNTAFSFKGKNLEMAQVARQTKATHVLEGSVRKAGNRVRITAQLIDAANDAHVWADRYDRDLNDIFALQDEISKAIVAALRLTLLPAEKRALEQRSTNNAEAYKLFLMARQFSVMGNERHQASVVRICQRAVELDPNYARAWAAMALAQREMFARSASDDDGSRAAKRALALDPGLADAYAALGSVHEGRAEFDKGLRYCEAALRLDPKSYEGNRIAGLCSLALRRFDDAVRYFEAAAEVIETEFYCWLHGGAVLSRQGRYRRGSRPRRDARWSRWRRSSRRNRTTDGRWDWGWPYSPPSARRSAPGSGSPEGAWSIRTTSTCTSTSPARWCGSAITTGRST